MRNWRVITADESRIQPDGARAALRGFNDAAHEWTAKGRAGGEFCARVRPLSERAGLAGFGRLAGKTTFDPRDMTDGAQAFVDFATRGVE